MKYNTPDNSIIWEKYSQVNEINVNTNLGGREDDIKVLLSDFIKDQTTINSFISFVTIVQSAADMMKSHGVEDIEAALYDTRNPVVKLDTEYHTLEKAVFAITQHLSERFVDIVPEETRIGLYKYGAKAQFKGEVEFLALIHRVIISLLYDIIVGQVESDNIQAAYNDQLLVIDDDVKMAIKRSLEDLSVESLKKSEKIMDEIDDLGTGPVGPSADSGGSEDDRL